MNVNPPSTGRQAKILSPFSIFLVLACACCHAHGDERCSHGDTWCQYNQPGQQESRKDPKLEERREDMQRAAIDKVQIDIQQCVQAGLSYQAMKRGMDLAVEAHTKKPQPIKPTDYYNEAYEGCMAKREKERRK